MTEMRTFDRDEISGLISMGAAIDALHDCFTRRPSHVARCSYPIAGGEFLVMPATDDDFAGVKLLMVQPANAARGAPVIQGMYVLFDAASGRPSAVLDGAALTTLRTPAA